MHNADSSRRHAALLLLLLQVPDPMARYKQLLFYAAKLPPMAPELHSPDNKVEGCVSQVRAAVHAAGTCKQGLRGAGSSSSSTSQPQPLRLLLQQTTTPPPTAPPGVGAPRAA